MASVEQDSLDAAAHRYCIEAIAASPAPEATTSEGIYWLSERVASLENQRDLLVLEAEQRTSERDDLRAKVAAVEAVIADPNFTNGHVSVVRLSAALSPTGRAE